MKKTLKSSIFFLFQIVFFLIVPCVLIWIQYGQTDVLWYRLSITGIVLLFIVFLVFKKVVLKPFLAKINAQVAQIEVMQSAEVNPVAIESLKNKFRRLSVFQLIFNAIMPVLVLVLFLMTIKVVEAGAIKMYNVLLLCIISIGIGIVFRILEIYALKCEHEVQNG